jgi:hypothetical protein
MRPECIGLEHHTDAAIFGQSLPLGIRNHFVCEQYSTFIQRFKRRGTVTTSSSHSPTVQAVK